MVDRSGENTWGGAPMCRDAWIEAMSTVGLHCRFDSSRSGASMLSAAQAGQVCVISADLAWQSVSPMRDTFPIDQYLFVQVVTGGMRSIEQHGHMTTFHPGDMLVFDPLVKYNASVHESTRMTTLRIPKSALRERGLSYCFPAVCRPDRASPDVRAVGEFLLYLASQASVASESLLARLGDQCLDLIEVLISDPIRSASRRSSATTMLRVKQLIDRRIGDSDLGVASIAAELNMSISSLKRALEAHGLSPMRYALSLRLEHAARLLSGTPQGTIQAVAHRCGFADATHFSRAFKNRYAMTPREYAESRKKARELATEKEQCAYD